MSSRLFQGIPWGRSTRAKSYFNPDYHLGVPGTPAGPTPKGINKAVELGPSETMPVAAGLYIESASSVAQLMPITDSGSQWDENVRDN